MFKKQKFYKRAIVIGIMLIITLFVVNAMGQKQAESMESKDIKTVLFKDINATMEAAKKAQADILAPDNFGEAMKLYKKAEVDLKKGENLDDIRKNLRESGKYFKKAIDATKLAEVTFPNLMKARKDAQFTEAPKFAANLWKEAEEKFKDAAIELEGGDVNDAKEEAGEAETLYRKSELAAIKANYLDETRRLLKQADDSDVDDYAPKTLQLSQKLVKQAEKELNENRYDTDVARGLARQANYQAKHAIYLANTIEQMKDKDNTWEDLMLASEKPLQQIAEQTPIIASFENGMGKTTNEIINYITTNKDRVAGLSQDLYLSKVETDLQHARIAEMEKQLGSQANEKSSLAKQIANQAKSREQFTNVEKSFSNDEALVLREGNDIILRLVGLNFPSAESTIEQKSFGLLTKVRDAINSYPECTISVLGNTDSYGNDATNLQLSTKRAEAVKQYLLANTKINDSRINVVGYGESKPIARNDTMAGRASNRRVEVVIHPQSGMDDLSKASF